MTPEGIIATVAEATGISLDQIKGRSRRADIVRARHAAMWLLREHTDLSYPKIGRLFGRHHTTVIHAVDCITGARRVNRQLDRFLNQAAA